MPSLIIQQNGIRFGGKFDGKVHIGRRPANTLVILDPAVSRLHAWIEPKNDQYFLADAASRTGTYLNHDRLSAARPLKDGDAIRIGPAQIIFHAADALPPDVLPIQFQNSPNVDHGAFFQCQCGQLLWAESKLAGRSAHCASCGAKVTIPQSLLPPAAKTALPAPPHRPSPTQPRQAPPAVSQAQPPAAGADLVCSVCHSPISAGEPTTTCPECGLPYHQQCWSENHGCAAYGCAAAGSAAPLQPPAAEDSTQAPPTFPWEYLLLAAAAAAIPVGALLWGIPGLILALLAAFTIKRASRPRVVAWSLALGILALVLGILISLFWWYSVTLW